MDERTSSNKHVITRTAVLFCTVVVVWWVLDRVVKLSCDVVAPGQYLARNVLGLFDFQLVHNTGAAWGMFGSSTGALGVFSLIVCALIVVYVFGFCKGKLTAVQTFSLALVCAGGLGNAVDRLTMGYVVDFINCTFIDFPVFNIADIGVTCGIVLFFIAYLLQKEQR